MEDVSLDETSGNGDEEDCLITESKNPFVATASTSEAVSVDSIPGGIEIDEDVVSDESSPERVERGDASSPTAQVKDPFPEVDVKMPDVRVPNGSSSSEGEISPRSPPVPSLFEKDVEFCGRGARRNREGNGSSSQGRDSGRSRANEEEQHHSFSGKGEL
ncbi:uncharacterized protein LOC125601469 [Brassica napus]|uniref:uncharacterized protein LOC125601469 n=1 Tax=Brassica napus TaxID=3708 RepID=UPI002079070B|nr:uncharacterized protein LOC125601469 [Brassica napus]